MERDFTINRNIKRIIDQNDKRPGAVADKAGIRRDTFSRIIHSRRPVFADELVPITLALGVQLEDVTRGVFPGEREQ